MPGARRRRVSAYGLAVAAGRVLLVRLRASVRWTLPGGGLDHGEEPEAALRREVREETGLDVAGAELFDVVSWTVVRADHELHAIGVIYRIDVDPDAELVHEPAGSSDLAAWHDLGDALQLHLMAPAERALRRVAGERG